MTQNNQFKSNTKIQYISDYAINTAIQRFFEIRFQYCQHSAESLLKKLTEYSRKPFSNSENILGKSKKTICIKHATFLARQVKLHQEINTLLAALSCYKAYSETNHLSEQLGDREWRKLIQHRQTRAGYSELSNG